MVRLAHALALGALLLPASAAAGPPNRIPGPQHPTGSSGSREARQLRFTARRPGPQEPIGADPLQTTFTAAASSPGLTLSVAAGLRGQLAGWLAWSAELGAQQTVTRFDVSGDGVDDYTPGKTSTPVWAGLGFGVPMIRRAGADASTTEVALVTGARVGFGSEDVVGVPLGVRLTRRALGAFHVDDRWVELRGLVFAPGGQLGLDAEVGWMPGPFGGSVFLLVVPRLFDGERPTCTPIGASNPRCEITYPTSVFNPEPYASSIQLGLRLRLHHAF